MTPAAGADFGASKPTRLQRLLEYAHIDAAVAFALLASGWQLLAAPITMVMIVRGLNPELQGYFYTFSSLVALQTYVELGLSVVVLSAASHEWARLSLDDEGRIIGDPDALSRLVSLGRFVFKWYLVAGILFLIAIGGGGHWFLARQAASNVVWVNPWWTLAVLSALQLLALPFNAILEGCNQVVNIQKFRFSQGLLRSLAMWVVLGLDGNLWAAVAAAAAALTRDAYLLGFRYRRFFAPFLRRPLGPPMSWRADIWPMQWRLGATGAVGYLLTQAFTPVMFNYRGPVVAGQMGMTLSILSAIQGVARAWLQAKVPTFGMLVARRDYATLDRLWKTITVIGTIVATTAAVGAWIGIWLLNVFSLPLADRLLPPLPSAIFLACAGIMAIGYCQTAYLRAHKKEVLVVLSIVTSIVMGVLVWLLGKEFGPTGAAVAYGIVTVGITFPWQTWIWTSSRRKWHQPELRQA